MTEVDIPDAAAWAAIQAQVGAHGAARFEARTDGLLANTDVALLFRGPGGPVCEVAGRVVHLTGATLAVTFEPAAAAEIAKARFDTEEQPLWQRYEQLTKPERIRLARHGGHEARRKILQDRDKTLHVHVLGNPRLTAGEVATLVRVGQPSAPFFNQLATRRQLLDNVDVVTAIVQHPRSPIDLAVRLVAKLPIDTARRIARLGRLRTPIVLAARKRVIHR